MMSRHHKKKRENSTRHRSNSKRRSRRRSTSEESEDTEETEETTEVTDESTYNRKKKKKKRKTKSNDTRSNQSFTRSTRMIAISSPSTFNPDAHVSITTDTSELPPPAPSSKGKQQHQHQGRRDSNRHGKSPRRRDSSKSRDTKKSPRKDKHGKKKKESNKKECVVTPCCPLCTKPYESPILLQCAHTFCKDCVTVFVEASDGTFFKCPVCLTKIKLTGDDEELFCPNFVILKQIDGAKNENEDLICSVCEDENEAEYFCEHCSDLLCEECVDAHKVVKYTKEHVIKEISEMSDISNLIQKRYFCTQHNEKSLDAFCIKCQQSVCSECVSKHHYGNQHDCISIQNASKINRDETKRKILNIKSHAPNLQISLLDIKRVKKTLRKQVNSVRSEISESMKRLMAVLKDKEKNLYQSVDRVYKSKINRLNSQKEKILIELEKIEACGRVLNEMENHKNDVEVLQMKTTLEKCLNDLERSNPNLTVDKETFLLKSNENNIKNEISKHGQVFRVGDPVNDNKKSEFLGHKKGERHLEDAVLISDFEDEAKNSPSNSKNLFAKFVDTSCDYTKGKQLKAKGNWLIVRSRVNDIIKYGKLRDCVKHKPKKLLQSDVYMKRLRRSKARTMKAKGNWLILKSHLSDVLKNKPPPKLARQRIKQMNALNVWSSLTKTRKSMRPHAIKARARANWLLVRSRVRDIVDYGRITGVLPLTSGMFLNMASRKRESKTLLKLKRFRAITIRARANWMLVSSRLKDITAYPNKKRRKPSNAAESWRNYREKLLNNRDKATRNKQIAGGIRAKANWLIVKSRIPDIILYGLYRDHLDARGKGRDKKSRSPSKSPIKDVGKLNNQGRARSISPTKSLNGVRSNWDILIKGTKPKRPRSASPYKNSDKQKASWDRLIRSIPTEDTIALTNWDKLIRGASKTSNSNSNIIPRKKETVDNWDYLINSPVKSVKKNEALKNWACLSKGNPDESSTEAKSRDALRSWDTLIYHTPSLSKRKSKSFDSLNDWDKLIASTPINMKGGQKSKKGGGLKNKQNASDEISKKSWDVLIEGTKIDDTKSGKGHWDKLKVGLGRARSKDKISEMEKKWDKLIANVEPDQIDKEYEPLTKSQRKVDTQSAEKHWLTLINGTPGRNNEAERNWDKLISRTKPDDSKALKHWDMLIAYNNDEKVLQRWDKLLEGTTIDKNSENNNEAIHNWLNLVQGTSSNDEEQALHHWDKIIKSGNKTQPSKAAYKHWDRLLEGKIIKPKKTIEISPAKNWDILIASPAPIVSPVPSPQSSRSSSLFRNWHKLTSKTPPLPKSMNTAKMNENAVKNWNTLISNRGDKEELAIENWGTLLSGENPYEAYIDKQPPGVTKLYEKPTPRGEETKMLSLNIKNSKREFHNVDLKLSSPDKSILSAHVAENSDGTFTIFCCPRIDNDFNMFVSLSGKQFKNEIKVVNFYGSFAGLRKHEVDLACRTISLLRWHLTPGLLTKKGDKVVARKGSIR